MSQRRRFSRGLVAVVAGIVVVIVVGCVVLATLGGNSQPAPSSPSSVVSIDPATTDAQLHQLFESKTSNVQMRGVGTVSRLLADDDSGSRHQRFILTLASGQTLLIAHNIDIAPRLNGLAVGDTVSFYGEYIYSDQGGTVHWTHHDPSGTHVAGWLDWNGKRYS